MKTDKSKCEYCGGKMVIEFYGDYGAVFPIKRDGQPGKRRIRRNIYEIHGDNDFIVYCNDCYREPK